MNLFHPSCQHDSCERDMWGVILYVKLFVIFVFLPGSEYVKVRLYRGVVVSPLHVKNLSALHNLSTVIHVHGYFQ